MHFFFLGMVLLPVSCTMSRTSIHSSSGSVYSSVFLSSKPQPHTIMSLGIILLETCLLLHSATTGKVLWYFYIFNNFPQFVVIHTVKDLNVVNEAEVDVFLELSYFLYDPKNVGNCSLVPLSFLNPACISASSQTAES